MIVQRRKQDIPTPHRLRLSAPQEGTPMTILYVLLAIAMLGVLITVHEFGHFMVARLTGILVYCCRPVM